jgi:hypothetical protein
MFLLFVRAVVVDSLLLTQGRRIMQVLDACFAFESNSSVCDKPTDLKFASLHLERWRLPFG